MRALVDATPLLGARTGVGQFVAHLLPALAARPSLTVDTYSISWRAGSVRIPARALHQLWRRVDWPPLPSGRRADVVHGTNYIVPPSRRAARVVTVHDLTAIRFPELVTAATRAYPDLIRRAVQRGAWVHTPSAFVAAEVVDVFNADPARVRAIGHGVVPASALAAAPPKPYDFPYVLALGTVEPRKDLPGLVRAFDALASSHPGLRLVVAGPDGWGVEAFNAAVENSSAPNRIVRLGYVDPARRDALLAGATVFAFPSVYEGFGLPPLEAMAAGVPVVATSAGAIPEVVGDAALLVAPGDHEALAEAIAEVLTDDARRADLIARGSTRAGQLRWEHTAESMHALYAEAAEDR
jgi:glycosyltransferase involved in cell wall biosynthesis